VYKIYIIRNLLDGKIYVGQTYQTVAARFYAHCFVADGTHLHNAIRKYGRENFTVKEIDRTSTRRGADLLEMAYICLYQATNPELGYNQLPGGVGWRGTHTEDTKKLISSKRKGVPNPKNSKNLKGRKLSPETRARMSAAIQRRWDSGKPWRKSNIGHPVSEETRIKISLANKRRWAAHNTPPVSGNGVNSEVAGVGLAGGHENGIGA